MGSKKGKKDKTKPPAAQPVAISKAALIPQTPDPAHLQSPRMVREVRREVHETHVGPLPTPKMLADYDKVVPHLAENIVLWATNEQQHRHSMDRQFLEIEKEQAQASICDGRLGQAFGFILTLAGFATAGWFASLGHPWAGAAVFGGTLLGIVWCFIFGSKVKANESLQQLQQVMNLGKNGKPESAPQRQAESQQSIPE